MDINNIIEYDSHYKERTINNGRHKGKVKIKFTLEKARRPRV